ncbi:MAG: hypothetical protein NTAFB01_41360 [Nitrospira sp.]
MEPEPDDARRWAWLTFVIGGGGLTDVELADAVVARRLKYINQVL